MKMFYSIVLVLVLAVFSLAGCGRNDAGTTTTPSTTSPTTQPTTLPTTMPTQPTTDATMPNMEDLLPGTEDTVDPSSGANQSTGEKAGRNRSY